jgi:hypothetical protein
LTLALLLLVGCAGPGGGPVQSSQTSPPIQDPNSPEAARARIQASEKALSPAYLQHRREAIAELLAKHNGFGAEFHGRLKEAQLGGPKVLSVLDWGSVFGHPTEFHAAYCAKVEMESVLGVYVRRSALIMVSNTGNGTEALQASVQTRGLIPMDAPQSACFWMNYTPFPELEQARARQRQALGMPD